MPQNPPAQRRRAILERIDPRVLYSADPVAVIGASAVAAPVSIAQPSSQAVVAVQAQHSQVTRELVVIDARVAESERLLADLHAQQAEGRNLSILTVLPGQDALPLINQALQASPGEWSAIHLVGHGQPGEMTVGDTRIDLDLIRARAEEFAAWSTQLAAGADLMLYGCDFAASADGRATVDALGALTGADVAASIDPTGSALLGGNWTLEYQHGAIDATSPVSARFAAGWAHVLADTVIQDGKVVTESNYPYQSYTQNTRMADTNASGRTAMVWLDTTSGSAVLRLAVMAADGTMVVAPRSLGAVFTGTVHDPTVAIDANGRMVVAAAMETGGGTQKVFSILLEADGSTGGRSIVAADGLSGVILQITPSIAFAADGRFVISYSNGTTLGAANQVRAVVYASDGSTQLRGAADVTVINSGVLDRATAVAWVSSDRFVVAFQRGPVSGDQAVHFRIMGVTAVGDGSTVKVGPSTGTDQKLPDVRALATGGFVVGWHSEASGSPGVRIQFFDAAGVKTTDEIAVTSQGTDRRVSLAVGDDQRVRVAWERAVYPSGLDDVLLREYTPGGQALGAERLAYASSVGAVRASPTILALPDRLRVVYIDKVVVGIGSLTVHDELIGPGISMSVVGPATTTEDGGEAVLSVVLTRQPLDPVQVVLSSTRSDEGNPVTAILHFDASNWSSAQTVRVQGQNDGVIDGNVTYQINAVASSSDNSFHGQLAQVSLTNIDNDQALVSIVPPMPAITNEGGLSADFAVVLSSMPTADVTITVTVSDPTAASASATSLIFTAANWNIAQTVTVTGLNDFVNGAARNYNVIFGAPSSSDAHYSALAAQTYVMSHEPVLNQAPTLNAPVAEDTGNGRTFRLVPTDWAMPIVTDPDAGSNWLRLIVMVDHGRLHVIDAGETYEDSTLTYVGTLSKIDSLLRGTTVFTDDGYAGELTFIWSLTDQGNTGTGGARTAAAMTTVTAIGPPTLTVGDGGQVAVHGVRVLTSADLNAVNSGYSAAQLSYVLTALPAHGALQLSGVPLGLGLAFTQDDVNQGRVRFVADAYGMASADFNLYVRNPLAMTSAVARLSFQVLGVAPVPHAAPLSVAAGQSLAITSAMLSATHPDADPDDIRFTISSPSALGSWTVDDVALAVNERFTLGDIIAGRVALRAGSTAGGGTLALMVSTPYAPLNVAQAVNFTVTIAPVMGSTSPTVQAGQSNAVSSLVLWATHPSAAASDIIFHLEDIPAGSQWRMAGNVLANGATFTLDDLNNGRVFYTGVVLGLQSTSLRVSTPTGPTSTPENFNVTVNPAPAPAVITGTVDVLAGSLTQIHGGQLSASHAYLPLTALEYQIVTISGEGQWSRSGTALAAGATFTQADLNAGLITFTAGVTQPTASLSFRVGTAFGPPSDDQVLNVTVHVAPTVVTGPLNIGAGQRLTITPDVLDASHPVVADEGIRYEIGVQSIDGVWRLGGAVLGVSETFTQADLVAGRVSFEAGGVVASGHFVLVVRTDDSSLTGGGLFTVNTMAAPVPVLSTHPLALVAAQNLVVGAEYLAATHPYADPSELTYTLASVTGEGRWLLAGAALSVGGHFTQADVNAGRLSFEAGSNATTASATVRVASTFSPASPDHTVGITIEVAPVIVSSPVSVEAGRTQTLSAATLFATHPDATADQMAFTIVGAPAHGQWLRDGQALTVGGRFTQADLNEGRISYRAIRAGADSLAYRLQAGTGPLGGTHSVSINVAAAPAPTVTVGPLALDAGASLGVGAAALNAAHPYLGAGQLQYTIEARSGEGVWSLGDRVLGVGDHFSQADVDEGRLSFRAGRVDPEAALSLRVDTGFGPGSASVALRVAVTIPSVHTGALALEVGDQRTLTLAQLQVGIGDASDAQLVYTIEGLPAHGELRLDGRTLAVGGHFTQADVGAGRVTYLASAQLDDAMRLSVSRDGGLVNTPVTVQIRVAAVSFTPPVPAPAPAPAAAATSASTQGSAQTSSAATATTASAASAEGGGAVVAPPTTTRFASRGAEGGSEAAAAVVPVAAAKRGGDGTRSDRDGYGNSSEFERILYQGSGLRQDGPGGRMMNAGLAGHDGGTITAPALLTALDEMSQRLRESAQIDRNLVASSAAVSAGVSIGYVIWMIRGGVLVSSMLASMPAWRSIDPFPVLDRGPARPAPRGGGPGAQGGGDDGHGQEDDSLAGMLDRARRDGVGGAMGGAGSAASGAHAAAGAPDAAGAHPDAAAASGTR